MSAESGFKDPRNSAPQGTAKRTARFYRKVLGAIGTTEEFKPGATGSIQEQTFVGPKLQKQLSELHPELGRVADYGILWASRAQARGGRT